MPRCLMRDTVFNQAEPGQCCETLCQLLGYCLIQCLASTFLLSPANFWITFAETGQFCATFGGKKVKVDGIFTKNFKCFLPVAKMYVYDCSLWYLGSVNNGDPQDHKYN